MIHMQQTIGRSAGWIAGLLFVVFSIVLVAFKIKIGEKDRETTQYTKNILNHNAFKVNPLFTIFNGVVFVFLTTFFLFDPLMFH